MQGHDFVFDFNDCDELGMITMNVGKRDLFCAEISDRSNQQHIFEFHVTYDSIKQIYYYEVWKNEISDKKKLYYNKFSVDLAEFRNNFEYDNESTHCEIITKYMENVIQSEFHD